MNKKAFPNNPRTFKPNLPQHQDFITYKDFASDKSLESADFEPSFGEINGSFYSSSNEAENSSFLINFQPKEQEAAQRKSKTKEEDTNYTSKPAMIIEREEIKRSFWCNNCMLGTPSMGDCLIA